MIGRKKAVIRRTKLSTVVILLIIAAALTFLFPGCDNFSLYTELDGGEGMLSIPTPGGLTTEVLTITPENAVFPIDSSYTFTAAGGISPYIFSVVSGIGSINEDTGLYTAPGIPGEAVIAVTDSAGSIDEAAIEIVSVGSSTALAATPISITLYTNTTTTFTAVGGVGPFTWSMVSGTGSINGATGLYTAPNAPDTNVVRITDSISDTSDATITVIPLPTAVAAAPASISLYNNNTFTFSVFGGVGPFTWSMVSGTGTIDGATGLYTAPNAPDTDVVRVTDSLSDTSDATITVYSPFSLSPSTVQININVSFTFTAAGGNPPYVYSVDAGGGSVDAATGEYTAPGGADSAMVGATDALGNYDSSAVTISLPTAMLLSPASITLSVDDNTTFTPIGGTAPYTFSILSGNGSIGATTGIYTAPSAPGSDTVRLTDNLGAISDSVVIIVSGGPLSINPSTVVVEQDNVYDFYAEGGSPPFIYSITAGTGTIHSLSGLYTAPAATGSDTVRVTDSVGTWIEANVDIAPAAPTNLVTDGAAVTPVLNTPNNLTLSWTDNATGEDGFIIERRVGSTGAFTVYDAAVPANTETYLEEGLSPNTLYVYRVKAYWGGLESEYSNVSYDFSNS